MPSKSYLWVIIQISLVCFFVGSALFFGLTEGLLSVLLSPLLALFGWFYYIVAIAYVAAIWLIFKPIWGASYRILFVCTCAPVGAFGMFLIGIYPSDKVLLWRNAYMWSGALAAGIGALMVIIFKKGVR